MTIMGDGSLNNIKIYESILIEKKQKGERKGGECREKKLFLTVKCYTINTEGMIEI